MKGGMCMKNKHIEEYVSNVNEFNELINNLDKLSLELENACRYFKARTLYPDSHDKYYFELLQVASADVMRINTLKKTLLR
jgi:hypothetical protein